MRTTLAIDDDVLAAARGLAERERKTSEVGELIMNRLRRYDKVAYVRFASVYLDFKDVQEFMTELKDLLKAKDIPEIKGKSAPRSN